VRYTFPDRHAENCYLAVDCSDDGSTVCITGWNGGADGFTAIDLSGGAAMTLAEVLAENAAKDGWTFAMKPPGDRDNYGKAANNG
jgi:hypothetical protein